MPAERRIGPPLIWGLAITLAVMLTSWFLNNFERQTREIETGFSWNARKNAFLAAERFLLRLDIAAESVAGRGRLRDLPAPQDVLLVKGLGPMNDQRREALHQWLSAGGHLVVEAMELWEPDAEADSRDFLARYGVRLRESEEKPPDDTVIGEVDVEHYPVTLEAEFLARYYLEDAEGEAHGAVSAGGYYRLLQYRVGEGALTVASDLALFSNAGIGERDHALFLALLTEPQEGGMIWLLYDSGVPGLGTLLWRSAPYALIAAACLVVITLWHLGARLGPLLPAPEPGRRDLLAHLHALAHFQWRHGRGSSLTRVTRERVERAWLRRHPPLRGLNPTERAAWIAERTRIAAVQVQGALYPQAEDNRLLVARTALLQRLWLAVDRRGIGRTIPHEAHEPTRGANSEYR